MKDEWSLTSFRSVWWQAWIRIEVNFWIQIHIDCETNADPEHWLSVLSALCLFTLGSFLFYFTMMQIRVADPHHFIRIRIQHFRLNTNTDPDPIRIQGFNYQKLGKNYSWKKKLKSYRRSLQLSKEAIQHFKTWTFNFFLLLWVIFALLDPDPDPLTRLNPDPIRIRIRIRNPELHIIGRHQYLWWKGALNLLAQGWNYQVGVTVFDIVFVQLLLYGMVTYRMLLL